MRIVLNRSKSGGISRVTNDQFGWIERGLRNLTYVDYKECSIWKKQPKSYHLSII